MLLWSLLTFLVSLAFAVRVFAILEDTPLTGTEADEYLPEEAYAPFGAAIIFFCLVPLVALLVWFFERRHPRLPATITGIVGLISLIVLPVLPSPDKWQTFATTVALAVLIVGGTYVGAGSVMAWAARRVVWELGALGPMIARTLPLFTLASLFLFYNAEIWQVMKPLPWSRIVAVAAVLGVLTMFLVAMTSRDEMRDVLADQQGLRRGERFNLVLVPVLVTMIQTSLFAALVFCFFCLFGDLSVSNATVAQWTGAPADLSLREKYRIPFEPTLIKVAFVLSGVGALNFAAAAASDENHREHFVAPIGEEIAEGLELRKRYVEEPITTPEA